MNDYYIDHLAIFHVYAMANMAMNFSSGKISACPFVTSFILSINDSIEFLAITASMIRDCTPLQVYTNFIYRR